MSAQHPTPLKSRRAETRRRASGVVDGVIDAVSNPDGTVSLHVRISMPGRVDADRIEVILPPEHMEALAEALAPSPPATARISRLAAIPCTVGVGTHPVGA
ncbi:hypothetical protein ACIQVN_09455 [Streptomyces cyaneofuscatus]|uniref:hypothetical protein n=1 Tax=Streptomyces cyaneofuscatus TaxID=66883 RepID=UPI0038045E53